VGSSPNTTYTDDHSGLDTTLFESKVCIAYLAVSFPQHSVGIGSFGHGVHSLQRVLRFFIFSAIFLISFVIVAWDGYDTKVFGRIYFAFLGSHSSLFNFLNDVI